MICMRFTFVYHSLFRIDDFVFITRAGHLTCFLHPKPINKYIFTIVKYCTAQIILEVLTIDMVGIRIDLPIVDLSRDKKKTKLNWKQKHIFDRRTAIFLSMIGRLR